MNKTNCGDDYFNLINFLETWQICILVALNIIAIISNLICNGSVVYLLLSKNRTKTVSMKLIMLLSISDCLSALTTQILSAVIMLKYAKSSLCFLEAAANFSASVTGHGSALIISLICFDRFIKIKYLTRYNGIVTKKRQSTALYIAFFYSVYSGLPYLMFESVFQHILIEITFFMDILIVLSIVIACIVTIIAMNKHHKSAKNKKILKNINTHLNKIVAKILVAQSITYVTYIIAKGLHSSLHKNSSPNGNNILVFFLFVSFVIFYWNGTINALLFIHSSKRNRPNILFWRVKERISQNDEQSISTRRLHYGCSIAENKSLVITEPLTTL